MGPISRPCSRGHVGRGALRTVLRAMMTFALPGDRLGTQACTQRVTAQHCKDLPASSWARQGVVVPQLVGVVPQQYQALHIAYWGLEITYQRALGVVSACAGDMADESAGINQPAVLSLERGMKRMPARKGCQYLVGLSASATVLRLRGGLCRTAHVFAATRSVVDVVRRGLHTMSEDGEGSAIHLQAAREALERRLRLETPTAADESQTGAGHRDSGAPSRRTFGFERGRTVTDSEASAPPVDDVAAGLAEAADIGIRTAGLLRLGLTFWVDLPGMPALVASACTLFCALYVWGGFGAGEPGRFVARAPTAADGRYYISRDCDVSRDCVTDEQAFVLWDAPPPERE